MNAFTATEFNYFTAAKKVSFFLFGSILLFPILHSTDVKAFHLSPNNMIQSLIQKQSTK